MEEIFRKIGIKEKFTELDDGSYEFIFDNENEWAKVFSIIEKQSDDFEEVQSNVNGDLTVLEYQYNDYRVILTMDMVEDEYKITISEINEEEDE